LKSRCQKKKERRKLGPFGKLTSGKGRALPGRYWWGGRTFSSSHPEGFFIFTKKGFQFPSLGALFLVRKGGGKGGELQDCGRLGSGGRIPSWKIPGL